MTADVNKHVLHWRTMLRRCGMYATARAMMKRKIPAEIAVCILLGGPLRAWVQA